jgi:hypothetical protein
MLARSGYAVRFNEPDPQNVDWWLVAYGKTSLPPDATDLLLRRWTETVGGEYGGSEARDEQAEGQYRKNLERLRQAAANVTQDEEGDAHATDS